MPWGKTMYDDEDDDENEIDLSELRSLMGDEPIAPLANELPPPPTEVRTPPVIVDPENRHVQSGSSPWLGILLGAALVGGAVIFSTGGGRVAEEDEEDEEDDAIDVEYEILEQRQALPPPSAAMVRV